MTQRDNKQVVREALAVARQVEDAFYEFSDSPADCLGSIGEILDVSNVSFIGALTALDDLISKAALIEKLEKMLETLADLEHDRWSRWMEYFYENEDDQMHIRWKALMNTPYAELTERQKESDRDEARKTIDTIIADLRGEG